MDIASRGEGLVEAMGTGSAGCFCGPGLRHSDVRGKTTYEGSPVEHQLNIQNAKPVKKNPIIE